MKNKIIAFIFPMLVFVLAIGTTFAFSTADRSSQTLYVGYKRVGVLCVATNVQCTDFNTGIICKDDSNNTLYKLNATGQCTEQLWKPIP